MGARSVGKRSTLVSFQHPVVSGDDGNPGNNNLVSQITDNLSTIMDLSRASIPTLLSSLEQSLAMKNKNATDSLSNSQSQGEQDRQNINGGRRIINPSYAHGFLPNYLPGNPAQQNLMGMGNAALPCSSTLLGQCSPVLPGVCSPSSHGQLLPGQCSPNLS